MTISRCLTLLLGIVVVAASVQAQPLSKPSPADPCGLPDTTSHSFRTAAAEHWGYGYDTLLVDLTRWAQSPYVRLDSIGATVQGRTLYVLTIGDTALTPVGRKRIWIHARTHPAEVQSTWVTNALIELLLNESALAQRLRQECVFSILPMYNPDGVELGLARQNANGVDLESNWDALPGEPEVQALRNQFASLMAQPNPILVALNMHSSVSCARYFVAHAASGTSPAYLALEIQFIDATRRHFPGGIEPWTYFVSWLSGAPTVYPESWFWYHHAESVLALTYEDMNCPAAGAFDSTATALLHGIGEFVGALPVTEVPSIQEPLARGYSVINYPNPFNPSTTIEFSLPEAGHAVVRVLDLLGREVARPLEGWVGVGRHRVRFDAAGLASGTYVCRLSVGGQHAVRRLVLVR